MSNERRRYELKARAESQRQTRERIVQATMELHEEVGPAHTTIAEIARRANVQRLTVYNHFSDETELLGACQSHWLALHPPPDVTAALAQADPAARLTGVLHRYYGWYRETQPMTEKVQRDRATIAPLDAMLRQSADAGLGRLADRLAAGFGGRSRGRAARGRRALIGLALDFWTWRRLDREGLDDKAAAAVMTGAVVASLPPDGVEIRP